MASDMNWDYSPRRPRLEDGDIVTVWVSRDGDYAQLHYRTYYMTLRSALIVIDEKDGTRRVTEHGILSDVAYGATWLECAVRFARANGLIGQVTVKAHEGESYDQHEWI